MCQAVQQLAATVPDTMTWSAIYTVITITDRFSSGVWKWECFCPVKCQQVESFRWMEQQQKKHDGPVRCVCEERRAAEHQKSAEPDAVHGSVPARLDTLEWLWSIPCESVQPVYRWPAASPEANAASKAAASRRCDKQSGGTSRITGQMSYLMLNQQYHSSEGETGEKVI